MSREIIAIAVGIIITWLVFSWAIKVLKASLSTAFAIAFILFALQIIFSINSQQLWEIFAQFLQKFLEQ